MSKNLRRSWSIINLFLGFFLEIIWLKLLVKFRSSEQIQVRRTELYRNQAIRFRQTALRLEGLLIKVGQFLSTRVDILPVEYTRELALLQDEVPSVPFIGIKGVIDAELGGSAERVFATIDPVPVAAASLGQVHRGKLHDGADVAIKVLRPGVDEIIRVDLRTFKHVIRMLKILTDWDKTIDLKALYREFSNTVLDELDYQKELANLERFRQNFKEVPEIYVPAVYPQYSSRKVITMEFVSGFKVTDQESLRQAGLDLSELAQVLVNAYLKQVLVDGFYHADPHPGNLFVRPDGSIIFIDFGMVGRIPPGGMEAGRKIVQSLMSSDAALLADGLVELGLIRPHANLVTLRKGLTVLLEQLRQTSFTDLGHLKVDALLEELREFIYSEPFQIPSNYTFLGRAIGTLSGLAADLDPSLNILDVITPYAKRLLGNEDDSWLNIAWDKVKEVGTSLISLPPLLEKSLRQLQNGEIQVKTELGPVIRGLHFQEVLVNRLMWTILLAASALIVTLFKVQGFGSEARGGAYAAGVFALMLLLNLRKKAKKPFRVHPGRK